jgi:hypothetical protein
MLRSAEAMANLTRDIMRRLMEFAIDQGIRSDNPFARIKTYELGTYTLGPITSSLLMRNVGLSVHPNVLPTQFYSTPADVAVMPQTCCDQQESRDH